MKLLLFGTGDYYQRYKKWFSNDDVVALIDNAPQKWNTYIDGIIVITPQEIKKYEYDYIIILSFQYEDMRRQLLHMDVSSEKIYHFYTLRELIDWRKQPKKILKYNYGSGNVRYRKKVLLMTQELTIGGPGLALLQLGLVLRKNGFDITIASMIDGPFRERLEIEHIDTVIDNNLQLSTMSESEWVGKYDLIICNTLNFHVFLSERNADIPCIWWLHDAEFFYAGADREIIKNLDTKNLFIYSVGPIPRNAINKINSELEIKDLLYCVEDSAEKYYDCEKAEVPLFVIIGFLEQIKGHDLLIDAIKRNYEILHGRFRLKIIGHDDTLYGDEIKAQCENLDEITFTGVVGRNEINKYLEEADALICPSRQDSMPTVVAEAMSHFTPCIISDVIGTAEFLDDNINCRKFETEDANQLGQLLVWSIENRHDLKRLGMNARKVYEKLFSTTAFENSVSRIIEDVLE